MVEIWDFEVHEHTVLDGFSELFNLIWGDSQAGKSAVIRALKLVCQNEFDPKSVRVGKENCKVAVTSEKGKVTVTRGKKNFWEVELPNGTRQCFDKIGKSMPPEIAAILGLNVIKLGDIEFSVNIMDQLEKHFMLAEIEGKVASGSIRAQIVDEISGLSGIETVIRDVSLDNVRNAKRIKELEQEQKDLQGQLHNQSELDAEKRSIEAAQAAVDISKECRESIGEIEKIAGEFSTAFERVEEIDVQVSKIPDVVRARKEFERAKELLDKVVEMGRVYSQAGLARIKELEEKIDELPDIDSVREDVERAEKVCQQMKEALEVCSQVDRENGLIRGIEEKQKRVQYGKKVGELIGIADESLKAINGIVDLVSEFSDVNGRIEELEEACGDKGKEIDRLRQEEEKLRLSFTVCPLTLKPITDECMKNVNGLVQSGKVVRKK